MLRTRHILPFVVIMATPALAGPPFLTDDPEPTGTGHFEIYAFDQGTNVRGDTGGESGIDFNYGDAADLQLTAVLTLAYDVPRGEPLVMGVGNFEIAAKYRFLHQDDAGWDVSVFPRVFLPSASSDVGEHHGSFLLPLWAEKDWGDWSTFGGGGCALNNGDGSKDYCLAGWALTRKLLPDFTLGAEIYHQTPDTLGGRATTALGMGATYDISDTYHLMASYGPGIQNAAATNRYSWYVALLTTF
jgi:Putative MetA-pathway of phenol degradation